MEPEEAKNYIKDLETLLAATMSIEIWEVKILCPMVEPVEQFDSGIAVLQVAFQHF